MDPKDLINYLGLSGGGALLFWLAWKFVFRNATDQSALATISSNFELMAKNLREQLEEHDAKIDGLEAEVKSLRNENRILRAENLKLREENHRLKYEDFDRV